MYTILVRCYFLLQGIIQRCEALPEMGRLDARNECRQETNESDQIGEHRELKIGFEMKMHLTRM